MLGDDSDDLPDTLAVSKKDIEYFWGKWVIWRATDRRFLPSHLSKEEERELATLLELDGLFGKVTRQMAKEKQESADSEIENG